MNRETKNDTQISALYPEKTDVYPRGKSTTTMRPSASTNTVFISLWAHVIIFCVFLGQCCGMLFNGLLLYFRIKVMKTDFITWHTAVMKVADLESM
jgi:hypothetical protein